MVVVSCFERRGCHSYVVCINALYCCFVQNALCCTFIWNWAVGFVFLSAIAFSIVGIVFCLYDFLVVVVLFSVYLFTLKPIAFLIIDDAIFFYSIFCYLPRPVYVNHIWLLTTGQCKKISLRLSLVLLFQSYNFTLT